MYFSFCFVLFCFNGIQCSRPGILFLINDADYVILGKDYVISDGDEIAFISTIHGG